MDMNLEMNRAQLRYRAERIRDDIVVRRERVRLLRRKKYDAQFR